jgi:hypothetical protein
MSMHNEQHLVDIFMEYLFGRFVAHEEMHRCAALVVAGHRISAMIKQIAA